jgi:hypothetical protein
MRKQSGIFVFAAGRNVCIDKNRQCFPHHQHVGRLKIDQNRVDQEREGIGMSKALILGFIALLLVSNPGKGANAQMQSEHYRITTSVMSGGGGPMDSGSGTYRLNGTMGQPSPLMDAADPPYSLNYDLYPGFWYTLGAGCLWDIEPESGDGDVDGADLAVFITIFQAVDLAAFAAEFGQSNCPLPGE